MMGGWFAKLLVAVIGTVLLASSASACRAPQVGASAGDLGKLKPGEIAIFAEKQATHRREPPSCASMGCESIDRYRIRDVVVGSIDETRSLLVHNQFLCGVAFHKSNGWDFLVLERLPDGSFRALTTRELMARAVR